MAEYEPSSQVRQDFGDVSSQSESVADSLPTLHYFISNIGVESELDVSARAKKSVAGVSEDSFVASGLSHKAFLSMMRSYLKVFADKGIVSGYKEHEFGSVSFEAPEIMLPALRRYLPTNRFSIVVGADEASNQNALAQYTDLLDQVKAGTVEFNDHPRLDG